MKAKHLPCNILCVAIICLFATISSAHSNEKTSAKEEPTELNSIEDIREKDGEEYIYLGVEIIYTGSAIITAIDGFTRSMYIEEQDKSAAIKLSDPNNNISGNFTEDYRIFDFINNLEEEIYIKGEVQLEDGMLSLLITEEYDNEEPGGPGNFEPTIYTLDDIGYILQSRLVKFENVYFHDIDEGDEFSLFDDPYTITDGDAYFEGLKASHFGSGDTIAYVLEFEGNEPAPESEIPHQTDLSITGIITQEGENMFFHPRFATDIIDFYQIIFDVESGNGSISATADEDPINSGDVVIDGTEIMFTAEPDEGNIVDDWIINGTSIGSTDDNYTVESLDGDLSVKVEFVESYEITFDVESGNGSISATADGDPINSGDVVKDGAEIMFTAEPDEGNIVDDWIINGTSIGSTDDNYTVESLDSDLSVKVEFTEDDVSIKNISADQATIFPNPANNYVKVESNALIKELKILDISGKTVYEKQVNSTTANIDIKNLNKGLFVIQITSNQKVENYKLQISR